MVSKRIDSKKKIKRWTTTLLILFILFFGRPYYKPAYSGRVVDFETGEPIVGAYITVDYWVGSFGLVEKHSNEITTQTYRSDKDGKFKIAPFFILTGIFNWDAGQTFSIKKAGYAEIACENLHNCLSSGCDQYSFKETTSKKVMRISSNLIELSKL